MNADFLNFLERNHDLFGSVAAMDFEVKIVAGDAADALTDIGAAGGFNDEHEIALGFAADSAEETGELGFDETAIESELTTLIGRDGGL